MTCSFEVGNRGVFVEVSPEDQCPVQFTTRYGRRNGRRIHLTYEELADAAAAVELWRDREKRWQR